MVDTKPNRSKIVIYYGNVDEELRNLFLDNRDNILANISISDTLSMFNTALIGSAETYRSAWALRLLTCHKM